MTFTVNNELALLVADPEAAEIFYTRVLGCAVFVRSPSCIAFSSGPMRLYLVRDPSVTGGRDPSYDMANRDLAIAELVAAGCAGANRPARAGGVLCARSGWGVV